MLRNQEQSLSLAQAVGPTLPPLIEDSIAELDSMVPTCS